jgi:hypothetical protein
MGREDDVREREVPELLVLQGNDGSISLYLNDERVAGPKPLGGGRVLHSFRTERRVLLAALGIEIAQ